MRVNTRLQSLLLAAVCMLLVHCKGGEQPAADNVWAAFYGTFQGNAEEIVTGEMSERELTVVIKPWEDKGFTVEWQTVIHRAGGAKKMTDLSIDFYPSARPGIYASAMRTDVFGQAVPYDPVGENADPYVWAGLDGNTLTVSALYIVEGGGYEMHVYKRSLSDDGLSLEFERMSDGEKVTKVAAQLKPVE